MEKLSALVCDELVQPAPQAARRVAEEIRRRHGDALRAVLFYGSCLRRRSAEGVLDFYALVDDYRSAYPASRFLAAAGALFPPNVHYVEVAAPAPAGAGTSAEVAGSRAGTGAGDGVVRAKYAVVSGRDFARGVAPGTLRAGSWARFCQPTVAVFTRDEAALAAVVDAASRAVETAVETFAPLLPGSGDTVELEPEAFWTLAFRETYAAEMRPERPDAIHSLYAAAPARFDAAARLAVDALARRGRLRADRGRLVLPPGARRRARLRWRLRRPAAKAVYAAQLLKTTATFGDWLPYALFKLERHSGTRLAPTPRQRAHPLLFGWPLLARALWRREFR